MFNYEECSTMADVKTFIVTNKLRKTDVQDIIYNGTKYVVIYWAPHTFEIKGNCAYNYTKEGSEE